MADIFETWRGRAATVHCWSQAIGNRRFATLEQAVDYCRMHAHDLDAMELFVHAGQAAEPIICGPELLELINSRAAGHEGERSISSRISSKRRRSAGSLESAE